MKKQVRAGVELILGLIGVSSPTDIFQEIFFQMFKEGNKYALIGYITAVFVGFILLLDGIAVLFGYKHLGEMLEDVKDYFENQ